MTSSRVAVVTRTKDRPLLLARALDSVLGQTFQDWTLVVVNDGGDPTPVDALLAERADRFGERVRVLHHETSHGMEAASNAGLRATQSEYVVIHDDDDSWEPAFLERCVGFLDADGAVYKGVITHTNLVTERLDGDRVEVQGSGVFNASVLGVTLARMISGNVFPPISFVFARAVLDEVGYYDESYRVMGDWEFNIRFLRRHDIGVVPEALANWHHRVKGAEGGYSNSVVGLQDRHRMQAAVLRNRLLRGDLDKGEAGVGVMANLQDALADNAALQEQVQAARDDADAAHRKAYQALSEQHQELLTVHEHLRCAITDRQQAQEQARAASERMETQYQEILTLHEHLRAAVADRDRLRSEADIAKAESAHHAAHVQHLIERLNNTYASTSWRVTAPLRLTSRALGGVRHLPREAKGLLRWRRHRLDVEAAAPAHVVRFTGPAPSGWVNLVIEGTGTTPATLICELGGHETSLIVPEATADTPFLWRVPDGLTGLRVLPMRRDATVTGVSIRELGKLQLLFDRVRGHLGEPAALGSKLSRGVQVLRAEGLGGVKNRLVQTAQKPFDGGYATWVEYYDTLGDEDRAAMRAHIARMGRKPVFSVVMPTYNTPEIWLRRAIDSVREQLYPHWEFCVADDASPEPHVRAVLEEYAAKDERIKVVFREKNGHISAATNSAIELVTGDYIALLDHDDELREHALYMMAAELEKHPDAALVFSDEDKIDDKGERYDPYFKSDWNPDLMLGHNMVCHLGVYRTDLIRKIGGFRLGYEGSQDYDLTLRFVEQVEPHQIRHIPHILYHWRAIPGSTALSGDQKSYAHERGRMAIRDHLHRRGHTHAIVTEAFAPVLHRVIYPLPEQPPKVSVIIPTRDRVDLLRRCVDSVLNATGYADFEVVVVDNRSSDPATLSYLKELERDGKARVLVHDEEYNYAEINNRAVREAATGEVLVFLNNDTEVISPHWLEEMVGHALRPEVGAVGCKLYYPNDLIQHAGVLLHPEHAAYHAFALLPRHDQGYFGKAGLIQNYSAVTAACMVVRRAVFEEVGGFDAENLGIAYNDVDLCLRMREKGYLIAWTPYAELYHFESATLGPPKDPVRRARFEKEAACFRARWSHLIQADPYYNPNLELVHGHFIPSFPPRLAKPWLPAAGETADAGTEAVA